MIYELRYKDTKKTSVKVIKSKTVYDVISVMTIRIVMQS